MSGSEQAEQERERRAWWLSTRRRRQEWQSLIATGSAGFGGRPRSYFETAKPGDPVLLYVSKPDHAIKAVGVVVANGTAPSTEEASAQIDVQLAFELPTPLQWREVQAASTLAAAEPVRKRSSGTLFTLSLDEYDTLRDLIVARNPEIAGAFAALDAGATAAVPVPATEPERPQLRERPAAYSPSPTPPSVGKHLPAISTLAQLRELTGLPLDMVEEARDLLEDTGQIILSGPPGTGKTWLARGLAALVAGDPARVEVVQFHPSTAYEDFVEGLKPLVDGAGRLTYAVVPGIFVRACEAARRDPDRHYVMVIDEINRAPLSRVFGELLYALEYRGPQGAVELSVSSGMGGAKEPFYVPENLLIIGTMNSADRSIALVDYAMRRRFRFVELEPDAGVLDGWLAGRGNSPECRRIVLDLFAEVNARLSEMLDPDHRLGHSYFMLDPLNAAALDRLWRTAIRPLVAEYFTPPAGEVEEFAALFAAAVEEMAEQDA